MTHFSTCARETGAHSSDREAWLKARRSLLTASDMPSILGHGRHDAFTVFHEKVNPSADVELDLDDPRVWGSVFERPAAEFLAKRLKWAGIEPAGALLQSIEYPEIGSTLDAEILRTEEEGWIVYEGKISQRDDEWDEDEQTLPTAFLVQAQTQLMVTGAPRALVFGLIRNSKTKKIIVEPYEPMWEVIAGAAAKFMQLVRDGEEPPVTAKSTDTLKRLYGDDDGSSVLLPPAALEWTRHYQALLEKAREIEDAKELIKNQVRNVIKKHTYGELSADVGGKGRWAWATGKTGTRSLTMRAPDKVARRLALPPKPEVVRELPPPRAPGEPVPGFEGFDEEALPGEVRGAFGPRPGVDAEPPEPKKKRQVYGKKRR